MITYQLLKNPRDGNLENCVYRSDGWYVPFSDDNTDYQAYLKWLAEGNTPLPAENA